MFSKLIAQPERPICFIAKYEFRRDLSADMLLEGHPAKISRCERAGLPRESDNDGKEENNDFHCSLGILRRGGVAVSAGRACIKLRGV